ncbi:MAG: hypothetical protein LBC68_14485, partial [Prevotellaceae bacterium]|nr:hypothetical protein [Prevotellaceae bacterium]
HLDSVKVHVYYLKVHLDSVKVHVYYLKVHLDFVKVHVYYLKVHLDFEKRLSQKVNISSLRTARYEAGSNHE